MVRRPDPDLVYDMWRCATCGAEYPHARLIPGKRGGPARRAVDRRYGFLAQCWANKACPTHKRKAGPLRVTLVADGAPNPGQPEQDDLDNINAIIAQKAQRKPTRRNK